MKAKKSVLGILLIIGMLLSCAAASYATATKAPKFTTSRLTDGNHGEEYEAEISVQDNTTSKDATINVSITDKASTDLKAFGITPSYNSDGGLTLTSSKLVGITSGYKFTVTATNQYEKKEGDGKWQNGSTKKEYTLKIKGIKPTIEAPDPSDVEDLGSLASSTGYALKGVRINPIIISTDECSPKVNMTATGLPAGLSLVAVNQPTSGEPAVSVFAISGEPTAVGTFKVTLKAENADKKAASGNSSKKYNLTVLDSPDIDPKKFTKNATYGKAINQKFKITGTTKDVPLTSADAVIYVGTTAYSPDKLGIDIPLEESDLKKLVINVKGTLTGIEPTFGYNKTTSVDIVFKLKSPAYTGVKEIHVPLVIDGTAPKITAASKKEASNAAKALVRGTSMDESIDIVASGPGVISWDVGKLPAGITSAGPEVTSDDNGVYYSTIKFGGNPQNTAKGYGVDIVAKNAVGSDKLSLKFTIDGTEPVITMKPLVDSLDNSPYKALAVDSDEVNLTLSADIGAVQWKFKKLPKGVEIIMSPDKTAKESQIVVLKGKPTAAMKATDVISVTATDPNTKRKTEVELKGIMVYGKPTIKTKKLKDVTLGSEYKDAIKAEGVMSWDISVDLVGNKLPKGLSFDSSDANNLVVYGQIDTVPLSGEKVIGNFNITVQAIGPGGKSAVTTIPVKFKGQTPKFTTTKLEDYSKATASSNDISITGTKPIKFLAYIKAKDAVKAGISTTKDIILSTDAAEDYTGFRLASSDADGGMTLTIGKAAGKGGSFKGLNITISADNGLGKPTVKSFKANMTGEAPVLGYLVYKPNTHYDDIIPFHNDSIVRDEGLISDDFKEFNFTAKPSADVKLFDFWASGDLPMTVKVTPDPTKETAGLKIYVYEDVWWDAATVHTYVRVVATKKAEAKSTKVTVEAKNGDGTAKHTITFNGQDAPVIKKPSSDKDKSKYTSGAYIKEGDQGKKFSFSLPLEKGTKPIKWYIHPNSPLSSKDLKASLDIEMDEDKGKLEGTPTNVTLSGDGKTYKPALIWVYAENAAGSSDIMSVDIGIKGSKPTLETKTITIERGTKVSGDEYALKAKNITSTDIVWSIEEKSGKKNLAAYVKGLELVSRDGQLSGDVTEAVKGASVPVIMNHFGAVGKGTVKITVIDPSPIIESNDPGYIALTGVKADSKGKVSAAKTGTLKLFISDDVKATGTSKITWKAGKPSDKNLSVKLTADNSDKNGNKATVTVTLAKGKAVDTNDSNDVLPFSDEFTVTATNSSRPKDDNSDTITIKIYVTSSDTVVTTSDAYEAENMTIGETKALEEDIVTDEELTAELGEGDLTIGAERTLGMLTAGQTAVLDEGRFVIAAILPEISATADGQYGLEVDLLETVKPGAKLYWFAFPKDAEDSEDDKIADFFDVEGKDTEVVPNDHVVIVYPWLRAGVTYGPVIAVKAEDAESEEAVAQGELEKTAEGEEASEVTEVETPAPADEAKEEAAE